VTSQKRRRRSNPIGNNPILGDPCGFYLDDDNVEMERLLLFTNQTHSRQFVEEME
jgi:hypothetical protein